MDELERLQRLVDEGDTDAARELMAEARRRDDRPTQERAATVLGETRSAKRRYALKRTQALRPAAPAWARELNDEQRAVALSGSGPMLVIAGAGSGKTRTLTWRVARLLELGVAPDRILLLTFSNRAAREMLRRVGDLVEGAAASRVLGGTFHHIGHKILRSHAPLLGYPANFAIMDSEDCATLIGACVAELGLANTKRRFPRGEVLQRMLSMAVNTGESLESLLRTRFEPFARLGPEIEQVLTRYLERKRAMGLMDYDDLLVNWRRLMVEHPEVGQQYAHQFEQVLVDEYQDSNALQSELVALCAAHHRNLMVVGDDCQSIYSFRGANFENILRFPQDWPDARIFRLEANYRSTPQILALANRSITFNTRRFEKVLQARRPGGALPALVPARDPVQQAQFVAERILELAETGVPLRNIAILYRAHYQSVELQLELTRANIPFVIRSGLRFFEQAHVKDALAYLRFVFNPRDELSFVRIATRCPGIGDRLATRLWEALDASPAPLDALTAPQTAALIGRSAARDAFARLGALLTALARPEAWRTPGELVGRIVDDEDYADHLRSTFRNADNRLADLEQLSRYAAQFDSLEAFLGELALVSGISGEDIVEGPGERDEYVVLSSVHQAKGLEWPVVFVTSLWDGGFPTANGQNTIDAEEEERRLFYVAVTRAMDELYLTYPLSRRDRGGHHRVLRASPFITELYERGIPPRCDLLEEWAISEEEPRPD